MCYSRSRARFNTLTGIKCFDLNKDIRMTFVSIIPFVLCSLLLLGCQSTYQSFTKEIPDKYIEVIPEDPAIDVEATLKASGKPYVCKELYFDKGSSKNRRACFIKLPEDDQLKRLKIRMEGTPEAMLLDTGKNILVVGEVFLHLLISGYVPVDL